MEYPYPECTETGRVVCQECGKEFEKLTPSHLRASHGMTFAEYMLKYPGIKTQAEAYSVKRFGERDSVLFLKDEAPESSQDEVVEASIEELAKLPRSRLELDGVPPNKAQILKHLHKAYPHIINNYVVEKRHFVSDHLVFIITTDMADPIRKVVFQFPEAYWHNQNVPPDPNLVAKLEDEGWSVISINGHYPTSLDVENQEDTLSG